MSGRRIDDHSSVFGKRSKASVFPDGPHKEKEYHSAEGSGHIGSDYPDTTEDVHRDQQHGDSKIKGRPMKTGYRY